MRKTSPKKKKKSPVKESKTRQALVKYVQKRVQSGKDIIMRNIASAYDRNHALQNVDSSLAQPFGLQTARDPSQNPSVVASQSATPRQELIEQSQSPVRRKKSKSKSKSPNKKKASRESNERPQVKQILHSNMPSGQMETFTGGEDSLDQQVFENDVPPSQQFYEADSSGNQINTFTDQHQ